MLMYLPKHYCVCTCLKQSRGHSCSLVLLNKFSEVYNIIGTLDDSVKDRRVSYNGRKLHTILFTPQNLTLGNGVPCQSLLN